ncbi:hypothetical protein M758_4G265400 [Ceratodon purpureus]|uniref:Uncharacterized protein n=1 Tax=Ceratodon purpureus TaxID=3225 RepID=A0A8T0IFX3_CERPU|nr:hypothetical protein KC19_4G251700 [Ceratodon purpureus]KAG0621059.1 hypothetical protein M758_4G265400 [Ceratodon purpureus]
MTTPIPRFLLSVSFSLFALLRPLALSQRIPVTRPVKPVTIHCELWKTLPLPSLPSAGPEIQD